FPPAHVSTTLSRQPAIDCATIPTRRLPARERKKPMLRRSTLTASLVALSLSPLAIAQDDGAARPPAILRAGPQEQGSQKPPAAGIYDEKADAKRQIASAVAKAKKENRRVLIQW